MAVKEPKPNVVVLPPRLPSPAPGVTAKTVPCTQEAIDALPPGSGDWSVEGVPGLYVRAGKQQKTFRLQRRVGGKLVTRVLGEMTAAQARRAATRLWQTLVPAPPDGRMTLEQAWQRYLEEKPLAPKTRQLYKENLDRYLGDWKSRPLEQLGADRAGFRTRILQVARNHGRASAASVLRTFRAIYNYQRRVNPELPECPTIAVDEPRLKPRDWALSDDELRAWWAAVQRLSPHKRVFWLTMLLTGARRDSVRMLRWEDVDFQSKVIRFSTAKAGRSYSVPMAERLEKILEQWRQQAPEGEWVFESPRRPGQPFHAQVRDDKRGVVSAHHLRHTMRTRLAEVGAAPDLARVALGHSLTGDVSRGYITPHLLVEAVRPLMNAVAERYATLLDWGEEKSHARETA